VVAVQHTPGAPHTLITLQTTNGQVLQGAQIVAQINFTALPNKPSAFGSLGATAIAATQANGEPVPAGFGVNGRAVFVGAQSLLEAQTDTNGQPKLILYGPAGGNFQIESTSSLNGQASWTPALLSSTMTTNLFQSFPMSATNGNIKLFRARSL
jgi:hypothetical protein